MSQITTKNTKNNIHFVCLDDTSLSLLTFSLVPSGAKAKKKFLLSLNILTTLSTELLFLSLTTGYPPSFLKIYPIIGLLNNSAFPKLIKAHTFV